MDDSFEIFCGALSEIELTKHGVPPTSRRTELYTGSIMMNSFDEEISFGPINSVHSRDLCDIKESIRSRKTEIYQPCAIHDTSDCEIAPLVEETSKIESFSFDADSLENSSRSPVAGILKKSNEIITSNKERDDNIQYVFENKEANCIDNNKELVIEKGIQPILLGSEVEVCQSRNISLQSRLINFNIKELEKEEILQEELGKQSQEDDEQYSSDSVQEALSNSTVLFPTNSEQNSSALTVANQFSTSVSLHESLEDLNLVSLPTGIDITISPEKKKPVCRVNPLDTSSFSVGMCVINQMPPLDEDDTELLSKSDMVNYLTSTEKYSFKLSPPLEPNITSLNTIPPSDITFGKEDFEIITVHAINESDLKSDVIWEEIPEMCDSVNIELQSSHNHVAKVEVSNTNKASSLSTSIEENTKCLVNRSNLSSKQNSPWQKHMKSPEMTQHQINQLKRLWGSPELSSSEPSSPEPNSPLMEALELTTHNTKENHPPRNAKMTLAALDLSIDDRIPIAMYKISPLLPTCKKEIENHLPLFYGKSPTPSQEEKFQEKTPMRVITHKKTFNTPDQNPVNIQACLKNVIIKQEMKKPNVIRKPFFTPLTITPQSMKKKEMPHSGIPVSAAAGRMSATKQAWSHGLNLYKSQPGKGMQSWNPRTTTPTKKWAVMSPVARYINEEPVPPLVNIVHSKDVFQTPSVLCGPQNVNSGKSVKISTKKIPVAKYKLQSTNPMASEMDKKAFSPSTRLFPSPYTPKVTKHMGSSKVIKGLDHLPSRTVSHTKVSETSAADLEKSTLEAVNLKRTKTLFKPI